MTPDDLAAEICKRNGWTLVGIKGGGRFKATYHVVVGTQPLALKVYISAFNERSSREIEAMKKCDHESVAKFISLEEVTVGAERYLYLLEEYLAGGPLTARAGKLTPQLVRHLALQLCEALKHIAEQNLVHRDLKPDNIMFRDDTTDHPVIVDFGIARDLSQSSLTASNQDRGPASPFFAAPEQLKNQKALIDARTDQFGLGQDFRMAEA